MVLSIKKLLLLIFFVSFLILLNTCSEQIVEPPDSPKYTYVIKGTVVLENQTEHSNTLVYIDSLNRGVSTNSSGNYSILFSENDSIYNGEFKIRYFLNDYDMDSAKIVLIKGKVKLDTLDIDSDGKIKTKEMKQIVLVEGWTDKQEYRIGDTLKFTARFTNVTDRMIHLTIPSIFNQLGSVGLYNDKYMPFTISACNPVMGDREIDLHKGYYEGEVKYRIRDRYYCSNGEPFRPDEYIVITSIMIEGRTLNHLENAFYKYIVEEWYKIHRGTSPKLDMVPNKYRLPHIRIIQ